MSRKPTYALGFGLVTDGWISAEPTDIDRCERIYKKTIREGEERLMLAVLEEAVQCFQEYALSTRSREKRLLQEAEEWFLDKNSDYIFSFEYICETLGFHPDHIRRGLMTLREAKRKMASLLPETHRGTKQLRARHIPRQSRLAKAG